MQTNTDNFPSLAGGHPEGSRAAMAGKPDRTSAGFHVSLSGDRGAGPDHRLEDRNRQLGQSGGAGVTLEF